MFAFYFGCAISSTPCIPSQVSRGSIQCRRDLRDRHEWQFSLDQEVACKDTQQRHQMSFESSQRLEALEWIKAKNIGSMLEGPERGHMGEDALSEALPEKEKKERKTLLPIKDKEMVVKRMGRLRGIS